MTVLTDRAAKAYVKSLHAQVAEILLWWVRNHPGEQLLPDSLAGLCERTFPKNRAGQTVLDADERMWRLGRARYVP